MFVFEVSFAWIHCWMTKRRLLKSHILAEQQENNTGHSHRKRRRRERVFFPLMKSKINFNVHLHFSWSKTMSPFIWIGVLIFSVWSSNSISGVPAELMMILYVAGLGGWKAIFRVMHGTHGGQQKTQQNRLRTYVIARPKLGWKCVHVITCWVSCVDRRWGVVPLRFLFKWFFASTYSHGYGTFYVSFAHRLHRTHPTVVISRWERENKRTEIYKKETRT